MFDFDVGLHYIGDCGPGGFFPTHDGATGHRRPGRVRAHGPGRLRHHPCARPQVPRAGGLGPLPRAPQRDLPPGDAGDRPLRRLPAVRGRRPSPAALPAVSRRPSSLGKPGASAPWARYSMRWRRAIACATYWPLSAATYGAPPSPRPRLGMHALITDSLHAGRLLHPRWRSPPGRGPDAGYRGRRRRAAATPRCEAHHRGEREGGGGGAGQRRATTGAAIVSNADAKRTFLEMVGEQHLEPGLRRANQGLPHGPPPVRHLHGDGGGPLGAGPASTNIGPGAGLRHGGAVRRLLRGPPARQADGLPVHRLAQGPAERQHRSHGATPTSSS